MRSARWALRGLVIVAAVGLQPATAQDGPPAGWPAYLQEFRLPAGRNWSQYRVRAIDGMPQALVPAGTFLLGAVEGDTLARPEERPRRRLELSAYWIDLHQVTNAQFARFAAATGQAVSDAWRQWARDTGPLFPAVQVSWDEAMAYGRWAGASLPTEAQWERAARGGRDGLLYPWGNDPDAAKANGNWDGQREWFQRQAAQRFTKPVGRYPANGFGVYDMCGNVHHWCRDWYADTAYASLAHQDPENTTPALGRVLRGGSWRSRPNYLRISARDRLVASIRNDHLGFRCAQRQ